MADDWTLWANGVLTGIGAPVTAVNLDALRRWTAAEKPAGQPTQWNNPLNTTQPIPGAVSMNQVGVRAYQNISGGVAATVQTLLNGNYGAIVGSLRASKPPKDWDADARRQLGIWGTGIAWLQGQAATLAPTIASPPGQAPNRPWPFNGTFDPTDLLTRVLLVLVGLILVLVGLGILFKEPLKVAVKTSVKAGELAALA